MSETNMITNMESKGTNKNELSSDELFKQGKRLYIVGEYNKALEYLTKSCKMRESKVGSLSDEMFEIYFYMAKSYFMYNKNESGVIGEKVEDYKDENDNLDVISEEDCEPEVNDNLPVENNDKAINVNDQNNLENNGNEDAELEKCINDVNKIDQNEKVSENNEAESTDVGCSSEDDKNISYLQLSYETIECAKLILNRQINEPNSNLKDLELKLADCCNIVGDIYMEEGIMQEAVNEYQKALAFNEKHAVTNDRAVAESYYNLAMAYMSFEIYLEAITYFEKCNEILVACHKTCLSTGDDDVELAAVIAEINEKLVECKEGEHDYQRAKDSIKQFMFMPTSDLPISEISHLVKRKHSVESSNSAVESSNSAVEPATKIRKMDSTDH